MSARFLALFLGLVGCASAARLDTRRLRSRRLAAEPLQPRKEPYHQQMDNYQNAQYFGHFKVGGQEIKGIFDTGSFELVVFSTKCKMCDRTWRSAGKPYDAEKSETYVKNGSVAQVVYGSGPLISTQGYEEVAVGPLVAKNQSFWEVTEHRIPVMENAKFSAIVGIGPGFAPANAEKTLLMSYDVEEFSICLERGSGAPGWMTWGPIASPEEKKTKFASAPVIGQHHWGVKMTDIRPFGMKKGGPGSGGICSDGCAAIVDSGTSLIAAPTKYLQMLSQVVPGVAEDCSNLHELPILLFELGEHTFRLPPRAYVMKIEGDVLEAQSVWDVLFFKPKVYHQKLCIPAFMQLDMMSAQGPVWILGMPFFRYYYTTFDRKSQELHFSEATKKCTWEPYKDPLANVTKTTDKTGLLSVKTVPTEVDELDFEPETVNINAIVPPTLSSAIDTRAKNMIL
jgi:hypothetical protein